MWRTGEFVAPPRGTEEAKFSDKMWGRSAQQYLEGITNLGDEKWNKILAKADKALRGHSLDSDDELDEEYGLEDIPFTGRAGIDDDDDEDDDNGDNGDGDEENEEMDGVEMTGRVAQV